MVLAMDFNGMMILVLIMMLMLLASLLLVVVLGKLLPVKMVKELVLSDCLDPSMFSFSIKF